MKDLFKVGLNKEGFFVFPVNSPPAPQSASSGDEVGFKQATGLCDSLNQSVESYIAQIARDNPHEILLSLVRYHGLQEVSAFIGNVTVMLKERQR